MGEVLLRCTIEGKPQPKQRARSKRRGGKPFTPEATTNAEAKIRSQVSLLHWRGRPPHEGPMELSCVFYGAHHSADADNLLKLVADALQGPRGEPLCYRNDRKIIDWHAYIRPDDGAGPRTEIRLTALEAPT